MAKKTFTVKLVNDELYTSNGENKYFVSATDNFLSGWGLASGKIAKRVIICDDRRQAFEMMDRMNRRGSGMKYVNYSIGAKLPYYNPSRYIVSYDLFTEHLFNF